MQLTRKMIDDGKSDNGAWSAKQLALLGVSWPPKRGWPERIIGTEISDDIYSRFLAIRKTNTHKLGSSDSRLFLPSRIHRLRRMHKDAIDLAARLEELMRDEEANNS